MEMEDKSDCCQWKAIENEHLILDAKIITDLSIGYISLKVQDLWLELITYLIYILC
jgi:hypothetical protein